jgi:hypothetical protein
MSSFARTIKSLYTPQQQWLSAKKLANQGRKDPPLARLYPPRSTI